MGDTATECVGLEEGVGDRLPSRFITDEAGETVLVTSAELLADGVPLTDPLGVPLLLTVVDGVLLPLWLELHEEEGEAVGDTDGVPL